MYPTRITCAQENRNDKIIHAEMPAVGGKCEDKSIKRIFESPAAGS